MFDLMPQHILEVDEVLSKIVHAQIEYGIEGVTFLGGEPMLQAKGLSKLAAECLNLQLSVVVFTGYTLEYLQTCSMPGVLELLKYVDLLIDGPYIASMPEKERNWVGSSNQRFHFLSKRYSSSIERDPTYSHGFELRISLDGTLKSNGWPNQFD
ncbi:hypothetical protein AGMMS50276_08470 [Synergistales bacterium]|nr:hypothetical protein AGMMS50276_08470 [Synergistales bacterium]